MFILDEEELIKLTGKKRRPDQCKALRTMGVPHRIRIDGTPIVTREAVNEYCGADATRREEKATIDLRVINGR